MSSSNGRHTAPAEFPPPIDTQAEIVKRELDDEDELIEVGVAIVGGGTAGLSCANRLLQLLADDEATLERLGEVPVAVIEKAKTCGGHNLSGAVMRPGPLQELFPDLSREDWRKEGFAHGEVTKEAVYLLPSSKVSVRVPTPPNFKNHGNEVMSVSGLARYQQRIAEEAGAYVLTETAASQLLVADGRVQGIRTGDKGRDRDGGQKGNFEPGSDVTAQARPAVPPPTIATPTSMRSSSASVGGPMNSFAESTGGGNWLGATRPLLWDTLAQPPFLAFTASVSLGTILLRSPTIPRSENSKIGAFASLLIATMFSEDCIPTLCWIAPEMPAAR